MGTVPDSLTGEATNAAVAGPAGAPHCSIPLTTPRLSQAQAADLAMVLRALAHPNRVQLMNLLINSQFAACAYDLQQAMGLAQSTLSHHLKLLVDAGLLRRQQRGIWAYYSVDREAMRRLGTVISLGDLPPQPLSPEALRDPPAKPRGESG
jgi:ArsR family transcriptional regulator, arsenate/arsenite/antimonite-responsive transcriptional repressor